MPTGDLLLPRTARSANAFWDGFPLEEGVPGQEKHYLIKRLDAANYAGPTGESAEPGTAGWYVEGTGTEAVDALDATRGGYVRIATSATENDATFLRENGSPWRLSDAGKNFWLYVELIHTDVSEGEAIVGLVPEDANADPWTTEPNDGYYWRKTETGTTFAFRAKASSVDYGVTTASTTISDDTAIHLGFVRRGGGQLELYSGATARTMQLMDTVTAANITHSTDLFQLVFGGITGTTAALTLDVKAICAMEI